MEEKGVVYIVAVAVAVFAAVFGIGVFIQKAPARIVKGVNWVAFAVAIVSGLASYNLEQGFYRYIFFAGLVVYFLTIKYKTK
ncbi:MAG: hypothetical protein HW382_339 [Deltaproteobacteria bacterium]|nr:hypothetical protein [Deltaproteobacteria bacterium]MBM2839317.1 hypothetical protein [Deltaproteobacteria bacterium]